MRRSFTVFVLSSSAHLFILHEQISFQSSFFCSQCVGMSGGEQLFRCEDPAVWRSVYEKYWAVVEAKAAGKQKASGKLLELEKWYNSTSSTHTHTHTNTNRKVVYGLHVTVQVSGGASSLHVSSHRVFSDAR